MLFARDPLAEPLRQSRSAPVLLLARVEPHWAGAAIGVAGTALGLVGARTETSEHAPLTWTALAIVMLGMLVHWLWRRTASGWRVHFAERRFEPVGQPAAEETITGDGWEIQTAPGERRHHVAIDLRHAERGRVARLVEVLARRPGQARSVSALADTLAERLQVARTGPRL